MYNYIKVESDVTSYNLYPPDMLLYYDYSKVSQDTCRLYFSELGDADFSVFSEALSFKRTALVDNAMTCLGISGKLLTNDSLQVLGNMVCVLDGSYIQNSDQLILQKLQNCNDLTDGQVAAIETLLTSGNTQYGLPATWNRQTLDNLGILPLYLTSSFYQNFSKKVKSQFLQSFLKVLSQKGTSRQKKRRMKTAIRQSIIKQSQSKRSIGSECIVGEITQVTISENTFPFNYETVTMFNCCLTAKTVNDNLDAITAKVDDQEYLKVVLARLREAYSAYSTIPEVKVQVLGPASRVATNADITMWNITKIDTLSALMDSSNGNWDAAMAQAIISKYLRNSGNTLGSAELNAIGGPILCSLDTSLLKTITQSSLSNANALTVTNCTIEKKRALFTIAEGAFQSRSTVSATSYQLTQPYIGGANSAYVQRLSTSNINMDMATFITLDPTVIQTLSVSQVSGLLGSNMPELKSYANQSVVQAWITTRFQSDLDSLGLGLIGGKADPTTVGLGTIFVPSTTVGVAGGAGSVTTVAGGTGSVTTVAGGAAATTASGGAINRPTFGLHLLLTTLAIAILYILH
ncbi:mesothelin-like protein [Coregonus clupeaformis]|uniref:mesothelin-like protein n=1 Tax=Coregonus clupeaformis TaxID=59861 RepID=UPI001E1C98C9|nr:mesothelin-like protein [Coregonus clupeaformis]